MALTREESLARYGTEAYTAWDEPGAMADARAKGINVMAKQPNPAQLTSTVAKPKFQKIKGFSDLQNQYAELAYNQPNYSELYNQYAGQTGLTDVKKLITDIDTSVADIEDKIAKVEPNINKEIGDYLVTEGQRGRMVNAEEQPLRTQYADILRSRSRLSAEAAAKAELVNNLLNYAQADYTGSLNYLKTLVDIEEANKKASMGSYSNYLTPTTKTVTPTEAKPTTAPTQTKSSLDDIFKGVTIDKSGNINTSNTNQQFDKYGNLILGGGMKLNQPSNKKSPLSTSTLFSRLLNSTA